MDRPLCSCHRLPMLKNGRKGNRQTWVCRVKHQGRIGRTIKMCIAGEYVYVGLAPTRAAALRLRQKIKQEAPNARRERPS